MPTGFQMAKKSSSVALRLSLEARRKSPFRFWISILSRFLRSPDGKHLAALSSDNKKLLLFDFQTQKWTDWVSEPGSIIHLPTWSRDGRYVYYNQKPGYRRVKVGQTRSDLIVDLKDLRRSGFDWSGLTPDDSALFVRDVSTDEIYAFELELP